MAFKNFKIQVIIRSVLIGISLFGFVFAFYQDKWYVTTASLFLLSVLLVADLIRYVEKTRRDISNFLVSVNLRDFTSMTQIEEKAQQKNKDLTDAFKFIANEFQNVRIEKETHYQYLQTVIGHVKTALICFDEKGKVILINQAAKELLDMHSLQSLDYLRSTQEEIGNILSSIQTGEQKLLKTKIKSELMQLSIRATAFKLNNKLYKLVALHDIKNELESNELESWQKLIRVLTHEIMNSVTPISSLSQAIKEEMEDEETESLKSERIKDDDIKDIYESIITIENRSKGLLKFVETYKSLTKLPKPEFEKHSITSFLNHIKSLMKPELQNRNIIFTIHNKAGDRTIYIDHEMMVRVMINLIGNAVDATEKIPVPRIKMQAYTDSRNRSIIAINDNGTGMNNEVLENIFIPFFTTKEKGSGIGLSLCRQIMHLHKGSITAESEPGKGSRFLLKF